MIVPYGVMPGFEIAREFRFMAAYYNLDPRHVRRNDGRVSEKVALCRAAMCWRMVKELNMPPERVARMMGVSRRAVALSVETHQQRILEFNRDVMLAQMVKKEPL